MIQGFGIKKSKVLIGSLENDKQKFETLTLERVFIGLPIGLSDLSLNWV